MGHDCSCNRILTFTEEQDVAQSRGREMKNITVWEVETDFSETQYA